MPVGKLKGSVGNTKRSDNGPAVKNNAADVAIVRHALIANGVKAKVDGKCDTALIKHIETFQKSNRLKVDGIIDAGGPTFAKLSPKYTADVKKLDALKMQKVKYDGKDYFISLKDLEAARTKFFKEMDTWVSILGSSLDLNIKTSQKYYDQAAFKDGYFKALCLAVTVTWKPTKAPSKQLESKAKSAYQALAKSVSARDAAGFQKNLPAARKAIGDFENDVMRFLNDITEGSKNAGTFLKTTTTVGFAVVGCFAAAPIAAATGMTAASATMASAATVGVLQKGSEEVGKSLYKWKLDPWSAPNILLTGVLEGVTAGIGTKWKFIDAFVDSKAAPYLAKGMAKFFPGVSTRVAQDFIKNYLKGAGVDSLKTAVKEGAEVVRKSVESGRMPNEKQFYDVIYKSLEAGALGGVFSNLQAFDKGFSAESRKKLEQDLFPKWAGEKISGWMVLDPDVTDQIRNDVIGALGGSAVLIGKNYLLPNIKGSEKVSDMNKKALEGLEKDSGFQSKGKKCVVDMAKKQGVF